MENISLRKVKVIADDGGHWFVIPEELYSSFYDDLIDEDFVDSGGFDTKYGQYMTGGDLNNVQLYANV